jgi:hypothetical protein
MKKESLTIGLLISLFSLLWITTYSQIKPVKFTFTASEIANKKYDIHLLASIEKPWHIFALDQPKKSIVIPTSIKFNKNPLISLEGKIKEIGTKEYVYEKITNISYWQYGDKIDFIQSIQLKADVNTNISGTVSFQVCNEMTCLPTTILPFVIEVRRG